MIEIPLTLGKIAIVDDEDVSLASLRWFAQKGRSTWYAKRMSSAEERAAGRPKTIYLHREVLQAPQGVKVDHRDGNGLNCRRHNLRVATTSQNIQNAGRRRNNTSGYKGVCWFKNYRKWRATIKVNLKQRHLGYFDDPEAAAKAYDRAARQLYGDFAALNFPNEHERAA